MDYSIKKEPLCVSETVFDGVIEQPVDLDFSLPDYCPDIQKILKCQICPKINSRDISGDKLYIEGSANILLIYLDEEKMSIRCCEHNSPFSVSINLKGTVQDAIVFTKTKTEYVNCRAVTPRRLDIHGAFSILTKVKYKKEKSIVNNIDGEGIEKKKALTKYSDVIGMGQQSFNISEVIDKSNKQPEVEYILKTIVNVDLQDYKTLSNKVIINAQANIKILYVSDIEYGTVDTLEHSIPISQILDVEGVQDDCTCDINIEVLSNDVNIKQSENEENNLLSFESKIAISVIAYEEKETTILNDVYSVDYESEQKYENISLSCLSNKINEPYISKGTIEIGDNGISEILDASGELTNIKSFINETSIKFEGKVNVCILARDNEEIPFYLERLVEFKHETDIPEEDNFILCEENIILKSCECKIIGQNSVEVLLEIQIGAFVFSEKVYKSVTDIYVDEEKPKQKDKNTALTIYYGDEGEELWDIARKYCTSVEKIKEENELDEDTLKDRSMIFIPML